MSNAAFGHARERKVAARLTGENWWVMRSAGSKGAADLVCLKAERQPMMLQVKATAAGPFAGFGPSERQVLLAAAAQAGARCFVVWWPKRGKEVWIAPDEWPSDRRANLRST
jgi:Holliday junction resolvase